MKPLEEIRAEPLTRLRSDLFNAFKTKQVSREFLANFLLRLEKELPGGENLPELGNIQNALQNGQVDIPPDLNSPANALAWGALFSHLQQQPDAMQAWPENRRAPTLKESPLWKQAIQSPRANFEKIQSASLLLDLVNDSVRLGWGPPGSWYCFLPEEKRINIDFLNTLIFGFEHSRSIVVHEIAHSLLSKEFPPAMTALREKMAALKKTGKTRPLTQDEYKELRLADTEWKLRHGITNPAEDNCVNRYAAIQGERLDGVSQHYGTSLNYIETLLISQKAEAFPTGPKGDLANLGHAVNMAFFSRNGLFQDTREGWTQSGVEVDRITRPGAGPSAVPPYRELAERLHTLASLQPDLQLRVWERGYGQDYYAAKTLDLCRRRNEIIDRIWDDYAAPFAQELLDAKEEEIEKKLQQNPSQEQQNSQGQGRGGGGEEQDSGSGGMGEEEEGGETLEVEGAGQQPSPQLPPRTPDQENAETAPGEDKDQSGPKQEADEEKTLRELIEEGQKQAKAEDRAREEREKQAQDLRATSAQSMSAGPGIDELPVGSWEDYAAEVARLAGPIRFVAQQLKQIQEKQLQSIQAPSRQRTLLPADGDFERFLPKAWDQLGEKKLSGNVQLRDYHLFRADHEKFKPSSIDAVILIDGSGSMRSWSWGKKASSPRRRSGPSKPPLFSTRPRASSTAGTRAPASTPTSAFGVRPSPSSSPSRGTTISPSARPSPDSRRASPAAPRWPPPFNGPPPPWGPRSPIRTPSPASPTSTSSPTGIFTTTPRPKPPSSTSFPRATWSPPTWPSSTARETPPWKSWRPTSAPSVPPSASTSPTEKTRPTSPARCWKPSWGRCARARASSPSRPPPSRPSSAAPSGP